VLLAIYSAQAMAVTEVFASDFDPNTWRLFQGWKPVAEISIYIAGPYTGAVGENVHTAIRAFHDLSDMGFVPFCPHLSLLAELHRPRNYEFWLDQCLYWVTKCDGLYRLPGDSPGADREVAKADELGIPVFHNHHQLLSWKDPKGWHQ
jgi:hypothetical protein